MRANEYRAGDESEPAPTRGLGTPGHRRLRIGAAAASVVGLILLSVGHASAAPHTAVSIASADASVSGSAPATVALDQLFDSTFTLTNNGPSAFTNGEFDLTVTGALYLSIDGPAGWFCTPPPSFTVCYMPVAGMASGATVTFVAHEKAPSLNNVGYDLTAQGSFGVNAPDDPNTSNNSLTVKTSVTGPPETSSTSTSTSTTSPTSTTTVAVDPFPAPTLAPGPFGPGDAPTPPAAGLPSTGSETGGMTIAGTALLLVGLGLTLAGRRSHSRTKS